MILAVTALFLSVGTAVAGQTSSDWNNSWGFQSGFEKSRLVDQALAIELVEEDGFNNTSTYFGTNDTYIGTGGAYVGAGGILQMDNSINDSVLGSFNTSDSYNKTKTTTTTTNINKTINDSNNVTNTNTTNTNINKNVNVNK